MYVDWIGNTGPLAMGLHGMPTTPETLMPALPDESHRCGNIHLPGYGRTPAFEGAYDFALVDDAIASTIPEEPVVLVGISGGAYRALRLALRGGLDIRGLVLLGPAAGVRGPEERDAFLGFAQALRSGVDLSAAALERFMTADERSRPEAAQVEAWLPAIAPGDLAAELEAYAAEPPLHDRLRSIEVPTLVLGGTDDVATPVASVREVADLLPHARLELLPGGHALPIFQASEVRELIAEFVGSLEGR